MDLVGVRAVAGIASNAVHVVVGAMLIAPAFEPMTKVSLGLADRVPIWRHGLMDVLRGMAVDRRRRRDDAGTAPCWYRCPSWCRRASAGRRTVRSLAQSHRGERGDRHRGRLAGTLLVIATRAALTGGVMIALGLIPCATLIGMGLATADPSLI